MNVEKYYSFEASHQLPKHPGKCSNLHGHSYQLAVGVDSKVNKETGFVLDYADLSELVKPIVQFLDHKHLNWLIAYPSSEVICALIYNALRPLEKRFGRITVRLSETQTSWASASTDDSADLRFTDDTDQFAENKELATMADTPHFRADLPLGGIHWEHTEAACKILQAQWVAVLHNTKKHAEALAS